MQLRHTITHVLERAYSAESDERAWLEGICEAASDAFEGQLDVQAMTASIDPKGNVTFGNIVGGSEAINARMQQAFAASDGDTNRRLFLSGRVVSASRVVAAGNNRALSEMFAEAPRITGNADVLCAVGSDTDGRICACAFMLRETTRLPARSHQALARLGAHLAAAYRIRGKPEQVDAVLDHRGQVLDAPYERAAPDVLDRLRHAALSIDRAKRSAGTTPELGLARWKALVEGRWTLVDRFDADGRRVLVACANEPKARKLHALTPMQCKIVALVALGQPSKLVAYELGLGEASVSKQLGDALKRLGIRSRAELIAMHGAIVGEPVDPSA